MIAQESQTLQATTEADLVTVRGFVKALAQQIGLGLVDQTKLVTATSELTRNLVMHGGGGTVTVEIVNKAGTAGIHVDFDDHGPGIADIELAMHDGHSTAKSLGLGLPGARRLVNEFEITSTVGKGTHVSIVKWK